MSFLLWTWCALTLGVPGSPRRPGTTNIAACSRGACGDEDDGQRDGAQAPWVSCPTIPRAGTPTSRAGVAATCRSQGLTTASVSVAGFGVQRAAGNLQDCAGCLTTIHRLLETNKQYFPHRYLLAVIKELNHARILWFNLYSRPWK